MSGILVQDDRCRIRFRKHCILNQLQKADRVGRERFSRDLQDAVVELEREAEVALRVWEMRARGMGPTEISRELSVGAPVWARRTEEQVKYILRGKRKSRGGQE